ncbi:MAG: PEP/pyruvate-binding domain-containing protein [Candidatus Aminicenantes bacterium]
MWLIRRLEDIKDTDRGMVGGKAATLALLAKKGGRVPPGGCITVKAFHDFLSFNGLGSKIAIELGRKELKDMRWEEMWDASQRIRNLVNGGIFPPGMLREITSFANALLRGKSAVVRSSSLSEDSASASYAGVHESYVDVKGEKAVTESVLHVWASLWSDAAFLYKKELGLDPASGGMAVILQKLVRGEVSGVVFSLDPVQGGGIVIEAVPGLNKRLVDGEIEPHRWSVERDSGGRISYSPPSSSAKRSGKRAAGVLTAERVREVARLALSAEKLFRAPQDVEWTFRGKDLFALQSRPITTSPDAGLSKRSVFDLSLRRSFENLLELRKKIEGELIPAMAEETRRMRDKDPAKMSGAELARELERRTAVLERWNRTYWDEFIPYGHGARLFGRVYNDLIKPRDPHEFVELLRTGHTLSMQRDAILAEMAAMVRRGRPSLMAVRKGGLTGAARFDALRERLFSEFGMISGDLEDHRKLAAFLAKMPFGPRKGRPGGRAAAAGLEKRFLSRFPRKDRRRGLELLNLARSSYAMRDDDNVYLAGIERELKKAADEARRRIDEGFVRGGSKRTLSALLRHKLVRELDKPPVRGKTGPARARGAAEVRAKQLRGQPASKGIVRGKARVVVDPGQLKGLEPGEILVCDSIGPEMTYAVSVAGGIVERRGGMLIHGAIVAREYGIPCVTGVPDAARAIRTGDDLTVDGYLGIVTIRRKPM